MEMVRTHLRRAVPPRATTGATFRVGRFKPMRIVKQTATRPAAEGLGFVAGDVHSRLVIGGGLSTRSEMIFLFQLLLGPRKPCNIPSDCFGVKSH
jgi:hypothetical protein